MIAVNFWYVVVKSDAGKSTWSSKPLAIERATVLAEQLVDYSPEFANISVEFAFTKHG